MSKQIDERVVSMQFDNKQFESGVQTSMSTLDKLKEKLHLNGASKGLENVNAAAKKVDMSGLASGVETVSAKFSALQVVGVTALANITNSVVNAGKRMVESLTVAPVKDGFQEYEMTMNAIQTTMSATGKTAKEVEKELTKLDEYADKTVYSTSDMLNNLPKFTNAGVELEKATEAMIGIANATALAGGDAGKASIAFYNLGQAIGTGYLTRMDYNSINNAGIATMEWKNQMVEAAIAAGTLTKAGDDMYKAGNKTFTLQQLFIDGLQEQWATTDVMMKVFGDYGDETTEVGKKAYSAAQDLKTFSMMMDSLKATAGTGWKETWQIIFGGLDEAKELWTGLGNFIAGIITKMNDWRNTLLKSAFGKSFEGLGLIIKNVLKPVKAGTDAFDKISSALLSLDEISNQVIRGGIWGSGKTRLQKLTEAGYNYYRVQNEVNRKLKNGFRYTEEKIKQQDEYLKSTMGVSDGIKQMSKSLLSLDEVSNQVIKGGIWGDFKERADNLTEAGYNYMVVQNEVNRKLGNSFRYTDEQIKQQDEILASKQKNVKVEEELMMTEGQRLEQLVNMTDEELKALGVTDEEIKALRELKKYVEMTGLSYDEFYKNIDKIDGRWLIIEAFKNLGEVLVETAKLFKQAWNEIFNPGMTDDQILQKRSEQLFGIIAAVHKLTTFLPKLRDENGKLTDTGDKLLRVFKGIFAIFDILITVVGGPIKFVFKLLGQILQVLGVSVLDVAAVVGDAIVKFRDWLKGVFDFTDVIKFLAPYIKSAADATAKWFKGLKDTKLIKDLTRYLVDAKDAIVGWFKGFKDAENIPKYIFQGLLNGLSSGLSAVISFFIELGKKILSAFEKVMDMHSPSRKFFEFGKNMMLGLFNGISEFVKMVYSLVMSVGNKIIDIVKNLDLGSIFTILTGGGIVYSIVKIANVLDTLTDPLESIDDILVQTKKTIKTFRGVLQGLKLNLMAEAVKTLAIAIAILAGSVAVLSFLDQGKVWSAVGAVAVLMGMLIALTAITGKFGPKEGIQFGKVALALLGLATSMLIMAWALKSIASIAPDKIGQALIGFVTIVIAMLMALKTVSDGGPQIAAAGATFTSMAWALLLMVMVAKIAGSMDTNELIQGGIAIAAFGGIIVGLVAATKLLNGSKNVDKIGSTILKIAGAMLLMVIVAKIAGNMEPWELVQGGLAIAAFGGIIVGLMAATKLITGSTNVAKIGSAIFGIAGAMLLMVIVAKIAATMKPGDLVKGTLAIAAFGGIIIGLMAATKLVTGSKNLDKIGKALMSISVSIALMAITAALLSLIDVGALAKGVTVVAILAAIMAGLIYVTKFAKNTMGTVIALTSAIAVLALSVGILSMIDTGRLSSATIAMGVVLGMFALVIASTKNVKKAMGTLIVLTVAIGVIAGVIYLLAQLPVASVVGAAAGLSMLMLALAGTLIILTGIGKFGKDALMGVLGLLALCVPLLALVGILALMQGVKNAAVNATVLAGFATVLTLLLVPLTIVGLIYTATGGMAMLGLVGLLGMCASLLALVGILALMQNIQNAEANATLLINLMTVLTKILVVLAIVGPLALVGVAAMAGLVLLIGAIGLFAVAIGALMQKFPALQSFLDTGIPVLVQLAGGIGEMIGAFVNGILTQIASGLPEIGANLSLFMNNAMGFINGAKMVDESVLAGVAILAGAIAMLTAVDILENITSFLNGGESFATLGTELSQFMTNAMPFIAGAKMIDPAIMQGVKTLTEAILILTGANLIEQITSFIGGESSLATFGSQLGDLGTNLNTFVTNLGTFTEDQVNTIDCAGRAIKALAESAKAIPNEGGWLGAIVGENSLGAFGAQFGQLGTDLATFVTNIGTFSEDQVNTIDCAGRAIKALAEAAETIPNEGGLWESIVGSNSLATFGSALPQLGTDLNGFITNLGTFDESSIATVDCAGRAIKALAEAAKTIPNEGGFWAKIAGDNSIATFGSKLPGLGTDISGFVTNLGEFGNEQIATVDAACDAITSIAALGSINLKTTSTGLDTLGNKLGTFGKKIKSFADELGKVGADTITSAISKVNGLIDMAKNVADINVESLGTFGDSLKKVAKEGIKGFVAEFTSSTPKNNVKNAAKALLSKFIEGAESKKNDVKKKLLSVGEAGLDSLESKSLKDDFKTAGKDLVEGFANGIKNNKKLATDAGSALGKAALKAAKEALDENSPSKEMYEVGDFAGQGFVNALFDSVSVADRAGRTLAQSSMDGLKNAVGKISDFISNDIDAEPTIRPVLDLSNIKSGANAIGSMFSGRRTLAVDTGTVGLVASSMAGFQNGNNSDEIVSSIKALRKDMAQMPRETISIGDITYDGDGAVADAVQTLVRAARIERRV